MTSGFAFAETSHSWLHGDCFERPDAERHSSFACILLPAYAQCYRHHKYRSASDQVAHAAVRTVHAEGNAALEQALGSEVTLTLQIWCLYVMSHA